MTNQTVKIFFRLFVFTILLFAMYQCGHQTAESPQEVILATINDTVTISLNEFIRRAEFTPRPPFCRRNSYLDKKIILNSLIAEKLMALETGGDNPISADPEFQRFLQGRKEQAMRQWMHRVEATEKVQLDTAKVKRAYRLAGREYEIRYYMLSDTSLVNQVKDRITTEPGLFEAVYERATQDSALPQRSVKWLDKEHPNVHDALFSREFEIGEVLPPVKIEADDYLFVQVTGWHDDMAFTPRQQQQRLDDVKETLTSREATVIWDARVAEIMRGKRLDFNASVFKELNQLFFNVYFHTDEERRDQFIEKIWDVERQETKEIMKNMTDEEFLQQPFFQVDGTVWTVADFRDYIDIHPLVFRERKMPSHEFAQQFRFAIADLVRDYYVTQEAYKRGYDQVNVVRRNVAMWRDAFLAQYQRQKVLRERGETRNFNTHYMDIFEEHLNPYIDELQRKYYKQIQLDFDTFEDIALTSIDLFVKQPEMPFKYVVPSFPLITDDHMLEYVTRME